VEVPVWVVAGVGYVHPPRHWEALARRVERAGTSSAVHSTRSARITDLHGVERVLGPRGALRLAAALAATDCPEPPELLADP